MDIVVIVSAFFSFFLFLLIHFLVFRTISHRSVIHGLVATLVLGNIGAVFAIWYMFSLFDVLPDYYTVCFVVSVLLFNTLSFSYILGVFGMMVASLRVRLLWEIYTSGYKGTRLVDVVNRYNCRMIVDERLARLLHAGEVEKRGGEYVLLTKFSVFRIHHFLYVFFKKLYTKK